MILHTFLLLVTPLLFSWDIVAISRNILSPAFLAFTCLLAFSTAFCFAFVTEHDSQTTIFPALRHHPSLRATFLVISSLGCPNSSWAFSTFIVPVVLWVPLVDIAPNS